MHDDVFDGVEKYLLLEYQQFVKSNGKRFKDEVQANETLNANGFFLNKVKVKQYYSFTN